MDLKALTEAGMSLGAGWFSLLFRVVLPNLRTSILAAIFLTFATVIGELTLAVLLAWPAFGPYMALVGRDLAYEPAALAILSFALTWGSIGIIQALSRGKIRPSAMPAPGWAAMAEEAKPAEKRSATNGLS